MIQSIKIQPLSQDLLQKFHQFQICKTSNDQEPNQATKRDVSKIRTRIIFLRRLQFRCNLFANIVCIGRISIGSSMFREKGLETKINIESIYNGELF